MIKQILKTAAAVCTFGFMPAAGVMAQSANDVLQVIYKVNDHWINRHSPEVTPFWHQAVYQTGNMEAAESK